MKTKTIINSILICSLMFATLTQAANPVSPKGNNQKTKEQASSSNKAIKLLDKQHNALLKTVNKGVLDGYNDILKATQLLDKKGKEKETIKLLQEATGKFDVALAAEPTLNLVPIDADVYVSELITTPKLVKEETDVVIDLLKNHKVQEARARLEPMKDEMVISHTYLPMGTYPDAIKPATKYLVSGKKEEALVTLVTMRSTIIIEKVIVPLAVVRAEDLLKTASGLDKTKDKDKANQLLDAAYDQLEIATLLGYSDKKSKAYEDIKVQIKDVKKEIDGKNEVEKMYDKLKTSIKQLLTKEKEPKK